MSGWHSFVIHATFVIVPIYVNIKTAPIVTRSGFLFMRLPWAKHSYIVCGLVVLVHCGYYAVTNVSPPFEKWKVADAPTVKSDMLYAGPAQCIR